MNFGQVAHRHGIRWVESHGPLQYFEGCGVLAQLAQGDAQQSQRIRSFGLSVDDLLIDGLRFADAADAVQFLRGLQL